MYYAGTSYKQTGEMLTEAYDISEPSKKAIYEWAAEYHPQACHCERSVAISSPPGRPPGASISI